MLIFVTYRGLNKFEGDENKKCNYDDCNIIVSSKPSRNSFVFDKNGYQDCSTDTPNSRYRHSNNFRNYDFELIPIEYFERSEACKAAKLDHLDRLDAFCDSREDLVLHTTLWKRDIAIERNMFPCKYCMTCYLDLILLM